MQRTCFLKIFERLEKQIWIILYKEIEQIQDSNPFQDQDPEINKETQEKCSKPIQVNVKVETNTVIYRDNVNFAIAVSLRKFKRSYRKFKIRLAAKKQIKQEKDMSKLNKSLRTTT